MAAPGQVTVIFPDGKTQGDVPADRVDDYVAQGYSVPSDESTGEQLATGAEGFARGVIPGFPAAEAAIAPEVGSLEAQKGRAAKYPITSALTAGAGAVAQGAAVAALTGGLGDLAEGGELLSKTAAARDVLEGAEPAEAVKAATATPEAISDAADTAALAGPTAPPEPAAYGAQTAAGAVGGATGYVNESELGDHEFNGQALAMEVGLSAILGAAGEGTVNILRNSVAPRILSKADELADSLGSKLKQGWNKAIATANNVDQDVVERGTEAILSGATKPQNTLIRELGENANALREKAADVNDAVWDTFQPGEAKKLLADVAAAPVREVLQNATDQLQKNLFAVGSKIEEFAKYNTPVGSAHAALGIAQKGIDDFNQILAKQGTTAFDLQRATVALRRTVDTGSAWTKSLLPGPERDLIQEIRDTIRSPLRNILNSADLWGPEMAARNAALNSKFVTLMNAEKNAIGDWGRKDWVEGQKEFSFDPKKIRATMLSDPLAAQAKLGHFDDWQTALKDFVAEAKTSAQTAGHQIPGGEDLEALLNQVTAQRRQAAAYQPVTELTKALASQPRWGMGAAGAAPVAGFLLHSAGAGPAGVAAGVAGVAALRAPVKAMQMFTSIAGAAARARQTISSGVSKILSNTPARVGITNAAVSGLRGLTFKSDAPRGSDEFQRRAHAISKLAADQGAQMDNSAENVARLHESAPLTAQSAVGTAKNGLQLLFGELPKNPAPSMIAAENKDWHPSSTDEAAWLDLHAAILKPPTFLTSVANGTADPRIWKALQAVYPQWTAEVQREVTRQLISKRDAALDTGQKNVASMILGVPVSPTVAPEQVAFQQQLYSAPEAPAGGPVAPGKVRAKGLDKLDLAQRTRPAH